MNSIIAKLSLLAACLMLTGASQVYAQGPQRERTAVAAQIVAEKDKPASAAQIVALDECDPTTFNMALGPGFCHNVALGASTKLLDLFAKAAAGTPDPNWDFEPDTVKIKKGAPLTVVDQGGEPHTFTEVAEFGGGFIAELNGGEEVVPECANGFSNIAVARTRILQGSQLQINGLSQGEHKFQCCIHPWMRATVDVK